MTWPFVIAPIVAAESVLFGNAEVTATEDPDDRAADHGKAQTIGASDQDHSTAGANHAPDDGQDAQTDNSPHLMRLVSKALGHDLPTQEAHAKDPSLHDAVATASPASDGGGGGGGGGDGPEATNSADSNSSESNVSLDSSVASTDSISELSGTSSGILTATLHQIVVGEALTEVAVGSSLSGLAIGPVVAEFAGLAPAATDVVSTLTSSVTDILAAGEIIPSTSLKDILGFDLQINQNGEFVATDLGAALDHTPSFALENSVLAPVVHTASAVVIPVADSLPALNFGISNPLDSLFGTGDHSVAGKFGDLFVNGNDSPSELGEATSVLKGNLVDSVLSNSGSPHFGNLTDPLSATSPDGSSNVPSTLIGTILAANAASDPTNVSIVGEATSMTPGHSIEFAAPAAPETDVLFRGNSYTDYHVALQSTGTSVESGMTSTPSGVTNTSDTTSLVHVDAPISNPPTVAPAAQHQDTSLTHVSTTISTTLDDLSLRGHTH